MKAVRKQRECGTDLSRETIFSWNNLLSLSARSIVQFGSQTMKLKETKGKVNLHEGIYKIPGEAISAFSYKRMSRFRKEANSNSEISYSIIVRPVHKASTGTIPH